MKTIHQKSRGYITLISVLVIGAVGVAIAVSLILLGLGSSRSSFVYVQSKEAWALGNSCAEEGLEQIRLLASFTGTGNLTFGQGTCTYTVTNTGGNTRTITASGTVGTVIRKVQVTITAINPQIVINTWQEVAN